MQGTTEKKVARVKAFQNYNPFSPVVSEVTFTPLVQKRLLLREL